MVSGCGKEMNVESEYQQNEESTRMVSDVEGMYYAVITDTETGVQYMYVKSSGSYGSSVVTLLNADGTPYVKGE